MEVDVPLPAQAAWRGAVRSETRRKRSRQLYRRFGAAAAAVVVLVGAGLGLGLKNTPKSGSAVMIVEEAAEEQAYSIDAPAPAMAAGANDDVALEADYAVLEADGAEAEVPMCAAVAQRAPAHELEIRVEDVSKTCDLIADLVEEYEGAVEVQQAAEGSANLYVEMPANNLSDFLQAVLPMDVSGQAQAISEAEEKGDVALLLVVREKE